MTTNSAEQNAPVRLNDDALEPVSGGARPPFSEFTVFNELQRGVRNGAKTVDYSCNIEGKRGKTTISKRNNIHR
ncbi:hypothetical protein MMB17_03115 [Methylobacterium organophilum]|uniref:hypothetical protein n=1 Tax=Methylobacterium organophilum TaxID=410 RepID=UPI001F148F34|nr:hypothetical protein [Methylobacterium organophilum]UMY18352.1 hypothetical protein MMB17_03115 [Methylobacterium organophilum]